MPNKTLTTSQLMERAARAGLGITPGSIRVDVHRGLVSPRMPARVGVGRGRASRWEPAAVRRVLYLARVRRLNVARGTVPLWAFLYDGWGWEAALPLLQRHARRLAAAELRTLNQPLRVRSRIDVRDNVDTGASGEVSPLDYRSEILPARHFLGEALWFGAPAADVSMVPAILGLMREHPVLAPRGEIDIAEVSAAAAVIERSRREKMLPVADVPNWLATLDVEAVARGREVWLIQIAVVRRMARQLGLPGSPRLLWRPSLAALSLELRHAHGRPAVAALLAESIINALSVAVHSEGIVLPTRKAERRRSAFCTRSPEPRSRG